ncbi:hypothetical protein ES703_93024 [subsurface metagenome]
MEGKKNYKIWKKSLVKSIGFVLELYLVKAGSKSCHYIFCRHHNSCLFHTEPAFENYRFSLFGAKQTQLAKIGYRCSACVVIIYFHKVWKGAKNEKEKKSQHLVGNVNVFVANGFHSYGTNHFRRCRRQWCK